VASATEEEIYAALGLDWIPPELRENSGEIEAAAAHTLPKLIEQEQIRGDLHMHTTESDGRVPLEEMAEAARARGLEYVAITDHSKALAMANGLDEKRAVAFAQRVREMDQSSLGIRVFSGLECDILRSGEMDSGRGRAGGAGLGGGERAQLHESGTGGDDGPPAARAGVSVAAGAGPSDRAHSAASGSVSVRLRCGGG